MVGAGLLGGGGALRSIPGGMTGGNGTLPTRPSLIPIKPFMYAALGLSALIVGVRVAGTGMTMLLRYVFGDRGLFTPCQNRSSALWVYDSRRVQFKASDWAMSSFAWLSTIAMTRSACFGASWA